VGEVRLPSRRLVGIGAVFTGGRLLGEEWGLCPLLLPRGCRSQMSEECLATRQGFFSRVFYGTVDGRVRESLR
jgi:hypothetical protein